MTGSRDSRYPEIGNMPMTPERLEQLQRMAASVARRPSTQGRPKWPRHGRARAKREAQRKEARS